MNTPFKFPRRVRIHGGECGAVARALHHEAQKVALTQNEQTLISDEKAFSRQAGSGKGLDSTLIERKQMSTKTSIKRIALVPVSALGFGLLSVAPSSAATARTTTVGAVTTTTIVAGVSSTLCQVDLSGALDVSEDDTIEISAVTGTVGGIVTWTSIGTAENDANTTTVGGAAENLVFGGGTDSGTDDQAVVGSIDLPGVYTFDWAGTGACTVRVLPSTSGAATLAASQANPVGISTRNNAITVSRNTGGANTDGVVLGQFTSTADSTDAPLSTVFGKVGSTTDLAAVSVGGSAATPVFTVARTNLTAGSYTVRFWVDSNTSQTFDS